MRMSCLLCVALVAAAPEARAQEPGPVEVVRAFYVALETGDSAAAINLLTPDVVVLEAGCEPPPWVGHGLRELSNSRGDARVLGNGG
jgi:ketosteroid isomerase-like protein